MTGAATGAGFSTRKMPPQVLQRTFTPPAGTFAESTGKDCEQDGQVTVMTMGLFGSGFHCGASSLVRHEDLRLGSCRRRQRRGLMAAVDHVFRTRE